METGTVQWFDSKKGWGFIEQYGKDIFVHYKDIQMDGYKKLFQGDKVQFEVVNNDHGIKAVKVSRIPPVPNCS